MDPAVLSRFSAATREWFSSNFAAPTEAQAGAWDAISCGAQTLVVAPTGSGKTLAAFLWALDRLAVSGPATAPQPGVSKRTRPLPADSSGSANDAESEGGRPACRVLYISPLKALAVDVERNLRSPLVGIGHAAERLGLPRPRIRVAVRSGDTPAEERRAFVRDPADILITTPESLFLLLTSSAREALRGVETVIIDEVHAVAGTKRGAHLALSLERLDALLPRPAQRIGLSATVRPIEEVARFLAGGRPVTTVNPPSHKRWDLSVVVPVPDLGELGAAPSSFSAQPSSGSPPPRSSGPSSASGELSQARLSAQPSSVSPSLRSSGPSSASGELSQARLSAQPSSVWPHVEEKIADAIASHRSTLVFVNSRRLAERLTARLNELWAARLDEDAEQTPRTIMDGPFTQRDHTVGSADPTRSAPVRRRTPAEEMSASPISHGAPPVLARAHHGSVSREQRQLTEEDLKAGRLPAVVATSSLELGIDMGAVDLVIQVEAPPSVASGLQRVGRAGHQVGATSHGVFFPKFRGDLVQSAVTVERMLGGQIEALHVPSNPLDVLAQQIVAMVAMDAWQVTDLEALVRRAAPFAGLTRPVLVSVLDMLAGRYPSDEFAELRPRLVWDRVSDTLTGRRSAQRLAVTSGGTIPDRGLYGVFVAGEGEGRRVGELDEEMVYESRAGDVIALGTTSWRIEEITHDRVLVTPAPGQAARLPFWKGDGLGRPAELGRAVGGFVREVSALKPERARERLAALGLDEWATDNLLGYLREQKDAIGRLPTDRQIVVERFHDELGDWRVVVHSPFGAQVHAPWALVAAARLRDRYGVDVQAMHADDGLVFRLPETGWEDDPAPGGSVDLTELLDLIFPDPDEVAAEVTAQVGGSALFASRFRECAGRALLLPNRRPGRRQALWQQRQRSAQLLSVAAQYPDFPIVLEAVRECLNDVFDLPALVSLMADVRSRKVATVAVETQQPSPFASSLLFGYVAQFLYEGDSPLAERRAAALALDPTLLAELLGTAEGLALADLLEPDALTRTELELQHLVDSRKARDADELTDLLRELGPLTTPELQERCRLPEVGAPPGSDTGRAAAAGAAGAGPAATEAGPVATPEDAAAVGAGMVRAGLATGSAAEAGPGPAKATAGAEEAGVAKAVVATGRAGAAEAGNSATTRGTATPSAALDAAPVHTVIGAAPEPHPIVLAWLTALEADRRVLRLAGDRWVVAEDASRVRDGLGVSLPLGVPEAFLEPVADPLGDLLARYARSHAVFSAAEAASALGIGPAVARDILSRLVASGRVVVGELRPPGWVSPSRAPLTDATSLVPDASALHSDPTAAIPGRASPTRAAAPSDATAVGPGPTTIPAGPDAVIPSPNTVIPGSTRDLHHGAPEFQAEIPTSAGMTPAAGANREIGMTRSTSAVPPAPASTTDYADARVLQLLRRRSLAALRDAVEPVAASDFARFLPGWQGVGERRGTDGLLQAIEQLAGVPVPASALESLILPARVVDYSPSLLDELTTSGEVLWQGHGAIGANDGWVSLHPAELAPLTLAPPEAAGTAPPPPDGRAPVAGGARGVGARDASPPGATANVAGVMGAARVKGPVGATARVAEVVGHSRSGSPSMGADVGSKQDAATPGPGSADVVAAGAPAGDESGASTPPAPGIDELLQGGGLFFPAIVERSGLDADEATRQLWELVWSGRVTNDSLAPLRALLGTGRAAHHRPQRPGRARFRAALSTAALTRRLAPPQASGRWSALPIPEPDATARALATAELLLDRYGIVTRGSVAAEEVPGGFAATYRVLAAAEDAGRVRRGYFVEGLGAAQFGAVGAIDRLRALARPLEDAAGDVLVLAATDPANPYGAALAWPTRDGHLPGRKAGALVVLVDGRLGLYVERGGRTLLSFTDDPAVLDPAARALAASVRSGVLGWLTVAKVDGESSIGSTQPLAKALANAGFVLTPQGLRMR